MRLKSIACAMLALAQTISSLAAEEIVTNPPRGDGFGSQMQTIIYSAIYAELNNKTYKYTPFQTMEHNYDKDPDFIKKKEWLVNMMENFPINEDISLQKKIDADEYIRFFESHLNECMNSSSLQKIKKAFRANKNKKKYFNSDYLNVAIHIRRKNGHDNRDSGGQFLDSDYAQLIQELRAKYHSQKIKFHIYSQGDPEHFKKTFNDSDIVLHINDSIEDTFTPMVLADVLVTAPSSLSYTAAILSDGAIYYLPFWHPPLSHWIKVNSKKIAQSPSKTEMFRQFISPSIPLRSDGKISIPDHIKHIKLDIGLSYNAPHSQHWLTQENNIIVFGFEPNPDAVKEIKKGAVKRHPAHGQPLDVKHIGNRFFMVPCALGTSKSGKVRFFVTKEDCGCSSVYEPIEFQVEKIIDVPMFSLSDFFDIFPFDTHPIIEYIKIDTQGADLDILKSAGNYLKDHVIYITVEAENGQYKNTANSLEEIEKYMIAMGFIRFFTKDTRDPTYLNTRFIEFAKKNPIKIFQM